MIVIHYDYYLKISEKLSEISVTVLKFVTNINIG